MPSLQTHCCLLASYLKCTLALPPAAFRARARFIMSRRFHSTTSCGSELRMCISCAWKARACATSGRLDGSRLVVDRAIKPCAGHIVLAYVDNQPVVKRLALTQAGLVLESANPEYGRSNNESNSNTAGADGPVHSGRLLLHAAAGGLSPALSTQGCSEVPERLPWVVSGQS